LLNTLEPISENQNKAALKKTGDPVPEPKDQVVTVLNLAEELGPN
jgi:hypothetical protein